MPDPITNRREPWDPGTGEMILAGHSATPPGEATVLQAVVAGMASALHGMRFGHSGKALGYMTVASTDCPVQPLAQEARLLVHLSMPGHPEVTHMVIGLEFVPSFDQEALR